MHGSESRNTSRDSYEKGSLILRPKNRLKSADGHYWISSKTRTEKVALTFAREANI